MSVLLAISQKGLQEIVDVIIAACQIYGESKVLTFESNIRTKFRSSFRSIFHIVDNYGELHFRFIYSCEVLPIPMKYVASLKCLLAASSFMFAVITSFVFLKLLI